MRSSRQREAPKPEYTATELDSSQQHASGGPANADRSNSGSFAVGELLANRFEIVRWIASGGMGDVYEAWDRELGECVAVKTIRQEIASDRQAMDRFRREISLARKVTHPGVCRIFDVFFHAAGDTPTGGGPSDGATAFLTMELLDGPTLAQHLSEAGPMSAAEAWPLVRQMAGALAAAHEVGVVHRDFKPSNVLLVGGSRGLRAVVSDFGLARESELKGVEVTAPGEVLGSPAYMAPEQATGGEITTATDVYSLGVVIFQMVTGRLPFEAASPLATLIQRVKEDPPRPSTLVSDLDPRWETAILKSMARDPKDRFVDAAEVEAALTPAVPGSLRSRRLRRRLRWVEGSLVVFLVVAAVAHLPIFRRSPVIEAASPAVTGSRFSVAVLGFKNLSGREDADWLATAMTELLATELATAESLRAVPGENVARMKLELAVQVTDGLAADTLHTIGQHLNTHFVVLGSYLATGAGAGNQLRLDLRIQDTATGETIATLSETATEAGLLGLIGRMGAELRQALGLDPSAPAEGGLIEGAALPSNSVAARFYAQGLAELRSFRALAARDLLRRAISADPDYALAYASLAEALGTLGYDAEAMEQIATAFELSAGLPREERLQVEGQYHERMLAWDRTIEIYQTLAEDYPDSLEYGLDLVRAQIRGDRRQDAGTTLERLRKLLPNIADDPRIDLLESELAWSLAQYPRALETATRAVEKGRHHGARLLAARAQRFQGRALWRLGRLEEAVVAARESERALFKLGDLAGGAQALNLCGIVHYESGDLEAASTAYQQALQVFRQIGSRAGIDGVLNNQAIVLQIKGDLDGAASLYEETLEIAREQDDKTNLSIGLYNLALVRGLQGRKAVARQMHEEALALAREVENPYLVATRLIGIAGLDDDAGDLEAARRGYREAEGIMRRLENQDGVAYTVHRQARLDLAMGDLASTRRRLEEALAIREQIGGQARVLEVRLSLARLALEESDSETAAAGAREIAEAFADSALPREEAFARVNLVEASLAAGRRSAARAALDRVFELSRSVELVGLEVVATTMNARIMAADGRRDEALEMLDQALSKAVEIGRLDLQLEARMATGEIELQAGRAAAGRERLAAVAQDASARGLILLADKARRLSSGGSRYLR